MEDKNIITAFKIILLVCIVIVAILIIIPQVKDTKNTKDNEQQATEETESEQETLPEIEQQTEVVVSPGGDKDNKLYEALLALSQENEDMYETALSNLKELSDDENQDAQYILGEMYFQGIGTDTDINTAAEYFEKAYNNGNDRAFGIYGKLKFMGDGIGQDYEEAYSAFLSVNDFDAEIYCAIGIMYTYGMGVSVDYDKAALYLDKAIEGGNTQASTVKNMISALSHEKKDTESAPLASVKTVSKTDYSLSEIEGLGTLLDEVCDKLEGGENYTAFSDELSAMSKQNPETVTKIAIFGKDNWLFFQNESDGDSYHDYVGDNEFSDTELEAIKNNLEKQEKKANAAGSEFVLMIYPNKEIIYSDKMPSYINRKTEVTRTDKLVSYLRENTDILIIYPKDEYLEMKDEYQLYYATDTHCNMIGTYVSLMELINSVYDKSLELNISKFQTHSTQYAGDIGVMIGRDDRYSFDTVYFLPESGAREPDKVEASMTLIGDSFSEFLNIEAGYYFRNGVSHYMVSEYSYDYNKAMEAALSSQTSDIIVWECAERCIERLK